MKQITENNLTWVDIEKPTQKDIEWLRVNFNFHPVTLSELIPSSQREKVEHFNDYLFLVTNVPIFNDKKHTTTPIEVDFLITRDHLITVHNESLEPVKNFAEKCKNKPELKNKYFGPTTGHLFYWLNEEFLNFAERQLVHIGKNIQHIEDGIFKSLERDMIREISMIKRDILDFRIAIRPLHRIFESLNNKGLKFFKDETDLAIYFSDLLGDYEKVWNEIDNYTDTINALENTNANLLNDKTNAIVKVFTILSFITFPAMLIATILQIDTKTNPIRDMPYDFWIVFGLVALTVLVMWLYFKTRKWL
ncbi:MAG: Mg2 transporter protein CorA family protein [Candidatus Giovannonibacteria bacterium GW2011_GWC2_44_8]|uniref:Mg2 transporter protein CorA family protein n=1 Tax=Candidatus Giovannonibacteria bacterium GW2011_GWC2_44_8 TaxID=1618657 RepID=A0A0G1K040_9BACT|nr:MAG: Mg2 transporter protein CorA family protein [Candidatus Giovannonibacteria bacterium GW2011_GWC2_44_8]